MLRTREEDCLGLTIGHYIRRAREERELASEATSSELLHAHLALAKRYEAMVALAHSSDDADEFGADECAQYAMCSQKLFPFHSKQGLRPFLAAR